jgi:hypothetical protein
VILLALRPHRKVALRHLVTGRIAIVILAPDVAVPLPRRLGLVAVPVIGGSHQRSPDHRHERVNSSLGAPLLKQDRWMRAKAPRHRPPKDIWNRMEPRAFCAVSFAGLSKAGSISRAATLALDLGCS